MKILLNSILNSLAIKHTNFYVNSFVENHSSVSFYNLSEFLSSYDVKADGVKILDNTELSNVPLPFILTKQHRWFIVENIQSSIITVIELGNSMKRTNMPIYEFVKDWNGDALLLDGVQYAKEHDYLLHKGWHTKSLMKKMIIYTVSFIIFSLFIFDIFWSRDCSNVTLITAAIIINAVGCYFSVLLLQKQLHIPNKVTDKICSLAKESHCETVTESAGATVLGLVKLSEVGMGFFMTNALVLLLFSQSVFWIAIFGVCVLPFSFWSVWYQKFRAKSWCVLCLTTLALMWLQAGVYFIGGVYSKPDVNWFAPVVIGSVYVLLTLLINKQMEILDDKMQNRMLRRAYEELKSNEKVVSAFTEELPQLEINNENCSSLLFGSPDADRTLTVFSNPYCGPCAMMHSRIKELPGNCINIRYVMTAFSEEKSVINKYIIAAYQQLGAVETWELLTDWFAGGKEKGAKFFEPYDLNITNKEVDDEFRKQNEWIYSNDLKGTPTDLLDGREIVWPYTVDDYFYLPK